MGIGDREGCHRCFAAGQVMRQGDWTWGNKGRRFASKLYGSLLLNIVEGVLFVKNFLKWIGSKVVKI